MGGVVRHVDCLALQGMDRLLTMLMMFYFISCEDTYSSSCTSTSDLNNNPSCWAVESSPITKCAHGVETPDDGGRAVDPLCSSSKERSMATVQKIGEIVPDLEQPVARSTGVTAGVSSSNGGVNIGRRQKRGDNGNGSCTAAAAAAAARSTNGGDRRETSTDGCGGHGCNDSGDTTGSGRAKGGGSGSEGPHSASSTSCPTRASIDRKEFFSTSPVKTAVKEVLKKSASVDEANETTAVKANEKLVKTAPGEKAPDSERPAKTVGTVKGEVEASGLLGERVYKVFAGLFEGFRLHDLYVPERGGVLVCTEVRECV